MRTSGESGGATGGINDQFAVLLSEFVELRRQQG